MRWSYTRTKERKKEENCVREKRRNLGFFLSKSLFPFFFLLPSFLHSFLPPSLPIFFLSSSPVCSSVLCACMYVCHVCIASEGQNRVLGCSGRYWRKQQRGLASSLADAMFLLHVPTLTASEAPAQERWPCLHGMLVWLLSLPGSSVESMTLIMALGPTLPPS